MDRSTTSACLFALLVLTSMCGLSEPATQSQQIFVEECTTTEQIPFIRLLVDAMVDSRIAQTGENLYSVATDTANRSIWWTAAIVGIQGALTAVFVAVAGVRLIQSGRQKHEIQQAAEETMRLSLRAKYFVSRTAERCREASHRLARIGEHARESERILSDCAATEARMTSEATRVMQSVSDVYLQSAVEALAKPGSDDDQELRRYAAVGIIGELGDSRHIRYLREAGRKEYETQPNKVEIGEAIQKIQQREQDAAT